MTERDQKQLGRTLWAIADTLRGAMNADDFRDYMLAFLFLIEGVLTFMLWWKSRAASGAFWILVDSLVTLALGGMIYVHWPNSSVWAIGTLVGISMIMSGVTRLMLSMAVRKVATQMA